MLKNNKILFRASAIYAIGEIFDNNYKNKLVAIFNDEPDEYAKANIAVSLLKLGDNRFIGYLVDILRDHEHPLSHKLIRLINEIPENYKISIDKFIYNAASYKIHNLLKKSASARVAEMPRNELHELKYCYSLLNSTSDILQIDAILRKVTNTNND